MASLKWCATPIDMTEPKIDLTLDRIQRLATYLPPYTRPTCHITGTNGKGSVTALLSSIFLASFPPLSVGRFNSPHLVSIYDSILIDDEPVTHDDYSRARAEVQTADRDHSVCASSFELLVMTALRIFECKRLDVVVIEVGMGGRLDATNIIPDNAVLVSALTAVDLDHQYFLGDTVEEIAREKAGIARRGKPFVVGRQKHPTVLSAVEEVLHRLEESSDPNLPISISAQTLTEIESGKPQPGESFFLPSNIESMFSRSVLLSLNDDTIVAKLSLYGDHQLDNLGIVISIISTLLKHPSCLRMLPHDIRTRITSETVSRGISSTKWPGRLSFHTITLPKILPNDTEPIERGQCSLIVLADGAHNPASSETLRRFINQVLGHRENNSQPISLTFVLALSYSPPKTPLQTLSPLLLPPFPSGKVKITIALVEFTPPEGMPWVRPVPPSDVRQAIAQLVPDVEVRVPNHDGNGSEGQVLWALRWAAEMQESVSDEQGLVVVAGSLYLVADFYRLLQSLGQS